MTRNIIIALALVFGMGLGVVTATANEQNEPAPDPCKIAINYAVKHISLSADFAATMADYLETDPNDQARLDQLMAQFDPIEDASTAALNGFIKHADKC